MAQFMFMSKKQTCKGDFCASTLAASDLIATTKDSYFYFFVGEIPERMHQEWLSLTGCSSTHFQKMGQLAPGRGKLIFLADIHNVCIAGSTTWGTWVKVEHYLHRNVCKMGVVHRKNVPRKYPTFKMNRSIVAVCKPCLYVSAIIRLSSYLD